MRTTSVAAAVELRGVAKAFAGQTVVDNVSLAVLPGEFFSLLGPSGCGKTTLLRMIGGFETPDAGEVFLGGKPANAIAPAQRPVNLVFQHYALFPHMSIGRNVAFALEMAKVSKTEIKRQVAEALALVRLDGLADRYPSQLSGGQQQRVALARALVARPQVLLLDEPLGALDLKLRRAMQAELKGLQRRLGIGFVYVTHDQDEAMSMSDRIAVMNQGRVEQLGTPRDVYSRPASAFVAGFIGEANLLPGVITAIEPPSVHIRCTEGPLVKASCDVVSREGGALKVGEPVTLSLRPEQVLIVNDGDDSPLVNRFQGVVEEALYIGAATRYLVRLDDGGRLHLNHSGAIRQVGERVGVAWMEDSGHVIREYG